MKIYAKLLVIALMIAMIFAVGSVSAVENGTADASDLTLVPHEQVVSVPDSTVQEVETIDTETSADDTNVEKISSTVKRYSYNIKENQVLLAYFKDIAKILNKKISIMNSYPDLFGQGNQELDR